MFRDQAHALCSRIAEEVREEIREDAKRVKSANVAKLTREIDKALLEADVLVGTLRRRCGVRDKNVSTVFNRELGRKPKEYLIDKRMRVAVRALAASDFEVWRIGFNVGYLTPNNFSRAFGDWGGKTPEEFRAVQVPAPAAVEPPAVSLEEIEQALAGRLDEADAVDLIERLGDVQGRIRDAHQVQDPADVELEKMAAAYLWRCIEQEEDFEIQRAAIDSHAAEYHTPALFLVLSTASVEASQDDPERALRLAELAWDSLEAIEERLGDAAPPFQVRAHAVAGHAFARAGRLEAAGRAFGRALEPFEKMNDDPNPVVLAELSLYLGHYHAACGDQEGADKSLSIHASLMHALTEAVREMAAEEREKETGG